jgi:hypothetical protein
MFNWVRKVGRRRNLPAEARAEAQRDRQGLSIDDPGVDGTVAAAIDWIGLAQDRSRSQDGGVARHYSLVKGWGVSYPETTGYIAPTLLDYARRTGQTGPRDRARRMLDWLASIQLPNGGFQAGSADAQPVVPTIFNTGQILIGLAAGVREWDDERYREAMCRAADWLVAVQDKDGCWRKYPSPFAKRGERTYDTHVAWGLFEAARLEPNRSYGQAGLANVRWALGLQRGNGWFDACCLTDPTRPLTHTIGYALRGVLEAYRFSGDPVFLEAGRRTAEALLTAQRADGFLAGRLDACWKGTVHWACLTGSAQLAACWLLLDQWTGDGRFRDAGYSANSYVRRTVHVDGRSEIRGAVKGSFPVDGQYGKYQYLNWACKFLVDSNLLERDLRDESDRFGAGPCAVGEPSCEAQRRMAT